MTPELKLLIILILINLPIYLLLGIKFLRREDSKESAIFDYLGLLFFEPTGYRSYIYVFLYLIVFIVEYVLLLRYV